MNPNCTRCKGEGWVCKAHPLILCRDGKGCCGEPAIPCGLCNPQGPTPSGFVETASLDTKLSTTHGVDLEFARKCLRLDQLLEKGDEYLTEAEGEELEALAHLLVDPEYQAHRIALIKAACAKIHN